MIHVGFISTLGRLRDVDPAQVSALARSIKEVGLLNPITVYPREIIRSGQPVSGYGLVAGAHRLEACKSLGWQEIPAIVVDLDDDARIIAECDENLCGSKLTAAEQAIFTTKRKEAYLRKHPETATPGPRAKCRQVGDNSADRFTADTAAKTGESERTVQRNAERGEKITLSALALVKGTALDKGVFLDRLSKIKPDAQCAYVQRELDNLSRPKPKPAAPERKPQVSADQSNKQFYRIVKAWDDAGDSARRRFREYLADRIE